MSFDLVLRGGRVIDPSQGVDSVMDVGFRDGRVAKLGAELKGEFLAAIRALAEGGVSEVAFYKWGHVRDANLEWIAEGLAAFKSAA